MPATFTVPTIFKAIDQVTAPARKMQNSVKRFGMSAVNRFKRVELAATKMRRSISKKLGSFGMLIGFAALLRVATSVVGVFGDFEQANAGLAAVMDTTVEKNIALTNDAKRLGAVTAKTATEVVGLQEAYARLGFAQGDIINMTESTIAGSIAMKSELADTAELVGAMVKSFDNFESVNAPQIIDQMTISTQKSALNFEKLQTSLPIVAGAANAAGIPFTKLLSLLGKLSDAGIDASSSSTALRNIFIESAKKGLSYDQILGEIVRNQDKLTAANDEFGKRAAVSAVILAKNISQTEELDKAIQSASNTAKDAADKQLNTLQGRVTLLSSAWEGYILSVDDGTGALSGFLKTGVEVVTEMLALASGTEKAKDQMTKTELRVRRLAKTATFLLKTIKFLTIAYFSAKLGLLAYNIALGITGALSGSASIAIGANAVALGTYKFVAGIATAAQWLLNTAMYGFPLVWILAAIVAVVAGIAYLVTHWDEMSEKLTSDWARISKTFKEEGLGGVFKMWGKELLIQVIEPLMSLMAIINKISGGKFGGESLLKLAATRDRLLEETGLAPEVITRDNNPTQPTQNNNRIDMFINDRSQSSQIYAEGTGVVITQTGN